jgi:hypothetical protein
MASCGHIEDSPMRAAAGSRSQGTRGAPTEGGGGGGVLGARAGPRATAGVAAADQRAPCLPCFRFELSKA